MAMTAILGKKVGMTQVYDETGVAYPVTVVEAGPCTVLAVKEKTGNDGYDAVQLGYDEVRPKRSTQAIVGHCKKANTGPKRYIREVRLNKAAEVKAGDVVTVAGFDGGAVQYVDVIGLSKGKGFQGVMRRWGFGGQPASHGTERKHRSPGGISMGGNRGTGRGLRLGKKMGGQWGHTRITAKHNRLVKVDKDNHLLLIQGSVPGPNGGYVLVQSSHTIRKKKVSAGGK